MDCSALEEAYLARRFVCPGCAKPTARPTSVADDGLACTDTEYCGWSGALDDAQELDL